MASKLEELEEELYEKGNEENFQKRTERRGFFPAPPPAPPTKWETAPAPDGAPKPPLMKRRPFKLFLIAVGIFALFVTALLIFLYLGTRGGEAALTFPGRDRIEAGELVDIPVVATNRSSVRLQEVELTLVFFSGTIIKQDGFERPAPSRLTVPLPDIDPGKNVTSSIPARLFGKEGDELPVEATLLYRPENLSARFSAKLVKNFIIAHVPLAISWEIPPSLARGQEVIFKVHYISNTSAPFDNLSMRLEYPSGFSFTSADPPPTVGDSLWSVGTLSQGSNGVLSITGVMNGTEGELKTLHAAIGVFNTLTKEWHPYLEESKDVAIAVTPLSVEGSIFQSRDRVIAPGDTLPVTVHYRNNTNATFRNVTVTALIQAAAHADDSSSPTLNQNIFDLRTFVIDQRGVYDGQTQSIVWGPGNVPELHELAPGAEGDFRFTITVRPQMSVRTRQDSNFAIQLQTDIEAANIPQEFNGVKVSSADRVEYKVASTILFSSKAFYHSGPILGNGPLPPRVGQKTTYTVAWEVRNFTNNLQEAEIRMPIPPNVTWENQISPPGARITFDPASSEVRWNIGSVPAGTGVLQPALTGAFQISIIPSSIDERKAPALAGESRFSARDAFTNEMRTQTANALSTELRDDAGSASTEWNVAP